jgi:hypothetical protein
VTPNEPLMVFWILVLKEPFHMNGLNCLAISDIKFLPLNFLSGSFKLFYSLHSVIAPTYVLLLLAIWFIISPYIMHSSSNPFLKFCWLDIDNHELVFRDSSLVVFLKHHFLVLLSGKRFWILIASHVYLHLLQSYCIIFGVFVLVWKIGWLIFLQITLVQGGF